MSPFRNARSGDGGGASGCDIETSSKKMKKMKSQSVTLEGIVQFSKIYWRC